LVNMKPVLAILQSGVLDMTINWPEWPYFGTEAATFCGWVLMRLIKDDLPKDLMLVWMRRHGLEGPAWVIGIP